MPNYCQDCGAAWTPGHTCNVDGYYTITADDVSRATIRAFGKVWPVSGFLGTVQRQDVGKRVYRVPMNDQSGYILQVENNEQRAARLGLSD